MAEGSFLRMAQRLFSAVLVLTGALAVEIDLTYSPSGVIKEGQTVVFQCLVTGLNILDQVKFVREIDTKDYTIISTNFQVESKFKNLGRYKVTFGDSDERTNVSLTISGIKGEDAGNIGCVVYTAADTKIRKFVALIVKVPVDSVELQLNDGTSVEDSATVTVTSADAIKCIVNVVGSNEAPKSKITLDSVDIEKNLTRKVDSENTDNFGLLKAFFTETISYKTRPHDNGKTLKCEASTPDFEEVKSISAKLNVQYAPLITCDHDRIDDNSENYKLTCTVSANPPPTGSEWSWSEEGDQKVVVKPGTNTSEKYTALQTDLEDNKVEVSLVINTKSNPRVGKYIVKVTNEVEAKEESVWLLEKNQEPPTTTTQKAPTPTEPPYKVPRKTEKPKLGAVHAGSNSVITWSVFLTIICVMLSFHQ